jgi:predicted DNA-binding protein (MmcQ/YjbR family)
MKQRSLARLRPICLALPEAQERETWGEATFRVREKIFCMHIADSDEPALWCKAPPGSQGILVGADPRRFFVPPYVGHKGWVGMRLNNRVDWAEVALVVQRSYRLTAPRKLAGRLATDAQTSKPQQRRRTRCRKSTSTRSKGAPSNRSAAW